MDTGHLNATNTIDLRPVAKTLRKEFDTDLLILHKMEMRNNALKIIVIEADSWRRAITIVIRNFNGRCDLFHIILRNAPIILQCDRYRLEGGDYEKTRLKKNLYVPSEHYTPVPLIMNATEIACITRNDIEPNADIIFRQNIGNFTLFRYEDDLIVTNSVSIVHRPNQIKALCTVLLKHYFDYSQFFDSIRLNFSDVHIPLSVQKDAIANAIDFDEWFQALSVDIRAPK